ncbi:hypothetical protein B2J93_8588 [Marssonina coronariae]|uniref:Uncharacterized protein n=1 Tax=Diplocarpon coronariae TaxID=2795749 RepID=A0A218Z0H0_9HELO|nr:hypothetical protein B2J93_8588 [Marssonina coronariae]
MLPTNNQNLCLFFPFKLAAISTSRATSFSSMSNGDSSHEATRQQSSSSVRTAAQALELARDSPEGAQDPTVVEILEAALTEIWRKVKAQPASYVMTRDEFAIFNYFQHRSVGQQLAIAARKRYWDHLALSN